jgi:hypothetical protein
MNIILHVQPSAKTTRTATCPWASPATGTGRARAATPASSAAPPCSSSTRTASGASRPPLRTARCRPPTPPTQMRSRPAAAAEAAATSPASLRPVPPIPILIRDVAVAAAERPRHRPVTGEQAPWVEPAGPRVRRSLLRWRAAAPAARLYPLTFLPAPCRSTRRRPGVVRRGKGFFVDILVDLLKYTNKIPSVIVHLHLFFFFFPIQN